MRRVEQVITIGGTPEQVSALWFDTGRWAGWVDGFDQLTEVTDEWPDVGGLVRWSSMPSGRGSVHELVMEYEPAARQLLEIQDGTIEGTQQIAFLPVEEGTDVVFTLHYQISDRSMFTVILEKFFVNRAMRASIAESLSRFSEAFDARH